MKRKDFTACCDCFGEGEIFEGAFMNSNPSSYADYEESWKPCKTCNGTGETWRHVYRNLWHLATEQKRKIINRLDLFFLGYIEEEEDIPF